MTQVSACKSTKVLLQRTQAVFQGDPTTTTTTKPPSVELGITQYIIQYITLIVIVHTLS